MTEKVILVCSRVDGPLLIHDNKVGICANCGFKVQYRPHAPEHRILRCLQCTADLIEPDDEVTTTPRMIEDLLAYFRKKQQ